MPKRPSKKPAPRSTKKVAASLRQLPDAAAMTRPRVPGVHVEADVTILVREIGALITSARRQVSVTANAALVTLCWQIGRRVRTEVLEGRRAEYGAQVVSAAGKQLAAQYGRGFGEKNLRRMVQFSAVFPDAEIVAALLRELGWTTSRCSSRSRTR